MAEIQARWRDDQHRMHRPEEERDYRRVERGELAPGYYGREGPRGYGNEGRFGREEDQDRGYRGDYDWEYPEPALGYGYGRESSRGYRGEGYQGREYGRYGGGWAGGYGYGPYYGGYERPMYRGAEYARGYGYDRDYPPGAGYGGRGYYGGYARGPQRETGGRDFWDRTSDEVSSWFGDAEAERRRRSDELRARHRGRGPRGYTRSDDRIREDVNDRLTDDPYIDATDIGVTVSNGEVTLNGHVSDRSDKRRAEDLVERVSGVTHVQNNLRVQEHEAATTARTGAGTSGEQAGTTTAVRERRRR